MGNAYRECGEGDIMFIPPSVVHEVIRLTEDAAIRSVTFELSMLEVAGLKVNLAEMFRRSPRIRMVFTREDADYDALARYIGRIFRVYGSFSTSSKMQLIACLMLIMSWLIDRSSLEESVQDKNDQKLRPVLLYVEEHYMEKIRIDQLSRLIHVCNDRLIRLFREVVGDTPVEYITSLRIEAGIKLLSSTDMSIAEIAEKTGFGSDTYMTRVYRQKLNTTPGMYRRR